MAKAPVNLPTAKDADTHQSLREQKTKDMQMSHKIFGEREREREEKLTQMVKSTELNRA